jgi:phosphomannomutase
MGEDLNVSMFRAYDIRTPSARLTPELAARLARAEARYFRDVLGAPGVVVAHDARHAGPHYLSLAADVFRDAGLDVVHLPGACSTSYLYYAAMRHPRLAGVMFGASHNPAGDTGQKLLGPGVLPLAAGIGPEGGLDRIRDLYLAGAACAPGPRGAVRAWDGMEEYIAFSMELASVGPGALRGTRVLQDYLFGASGREMMLAFGRTGADLVPLHFVADGAFPLGDPNPVKRAVIAPGLDALRAGDFLLGMLFDGDGDRLDVYRGDGSYLSSSFVYAAILPEIRRRFPGPGLGVFADLKCNPVALVEMARTGVAVDVIRNGHSQIKASLANDPARFGAVEESAHFYEAFRPGGGERFCTENTLYVALLLARVWREDPARFECLFRLQETTAREREWGHKFATAQARADALRAVREHFEGQGARALERMKNGMDLEATLLRRGLPFEIDAGTRLGGDWLQVCQRVSQSEDGLARWEVVGATPDLVRQARRAITECVRRFGAGEEYQG